jgi:NAD(P)-dependent dehydrogenase (short-subunit alcohol dehydrogenase family)
MRNLDGKVAVVTGAGSGIGRATTLALSRAGARVVAADIDETAAKETAGAATGREPASAYQVDVTSAEDMSGLVDATLSRHGAVDIVVNNAGIGMAPTNAEEISLETYRRIMDVNFWGIVHGSLLFLPHLRSRPEANLVNVASNAGLMAQPRFAPYCASKFAARGFSDALRMELRRTSVRVTVVYPGGTRTPIMANSPVIDDDALRQRLQEQFDATFGRPPETVADAVVNAIRKNRPRALVGPDTAVIDRIARFLPASHARLLGPAIDRYLDKLVGNG